MAFAVMNKAMVARKAAPAKVSAPKRGALQVRHAKGGEEGAPKVRATVPSHPIFCYPLTENHCTTLSVYIRSRMVITPT